MWSTMMLNMDTEPQELRKLKRQLANLNCVCVTCQPRYENRCSKCDDKEVQSEIQDESDVSPAFSDKNIGMTPFRNDILCPSCCVAINLIRGNFVKVLKDEESETRVRVCNKSSGITHKCVEKSTSVTNKPYTQISNLTLTDYMSEYSSDLTLPKRSGKRSHEKVKFLTIPHEKPERDTKKPGHANCLCLENFIDSIRPPMVDSMRFT